MTVSTPFDRLRHVFATARIPLLGAAIVWIAADPAAAQDRRAADFRLPDVEVNTGVLEAVGGAAAQVSPVPEHGADGLPLYDARLGPPRSHVIGDPAAGHLPPVVLRNPAASDRSADRTGDIAPLPQRTQAVLPPPPAAVAAPPPPSSTTAMTPAEPEPAAEGTLPADTATAPAAVTAALPAAAPPDAAPPPEPAAAIALDAPISVPFPVGDSNLPRTALPMLDQVAAELRADPDLRVRLKAYAGAGDSSSSAARRLSLWRALAVRTYLIDSEVNAARIDVRALGAKYEAGPPDRVDIVGIRQAP